MSAKQPQVYVLYTGGTLGMVPRDRNNPASPLVPAGQEELELYLPPSLREQLSIDYRLFSLQDLEGNLVGAIDSSDATSNHWKYMAKAIADVYDPFEDDEGNVIDYDGFVILHGTDTMAYTTSALSFMLANLAKPVVVTGSQLPISHPRTDAISNFVNALSVAGYRATGLPLIPEVILVFAGAMLRGNRVRKMSSSAWQGFDTPNYPHLGSIGEHIRVASEYLQEPANNEEAPFYARLDLEERIADISLFPGIQPSQLGAVLLSKELRGALMRTYGSGNAPSNKHEVGAGLVKVIGDAVKAGKVIVNVTQCPQGMVEAGLYEASSGLLERGVVSGIDLTPEAALTKLMSLLANEPQPEVGPLMQLNLRGEQSASLYDIQFGSSKPSSSVTRKKTSVTIAARPSGSFKRSHLQQATIRVTGVELPSGVESAMVDAYLNHPNAHRASIDDPRHAATFQFDSRSNTALADVTAVARRVLEEGRSVQLTLVPREGLDEIHFGGAFLALFTR